MIRTVRMKRRKAWAWSRRVFGHRSYPTTMVCTCSSSWRNTLSDRIAQPSRFGVAKYAGNTTVRYQVVNWTLFVTTTCKTRETTLIQAIDHFDVLHGALRAVHDSGRPRWRRRVSLREDGDQQRRLV